MSSRSACVTLVRILFLFALLRHFLLGPAQIFTYPNFFRIVLLAPLDTMKEAADRMAQFCQRHMTKTN